MHVRWPYCFAITKACLAAIGTVRICAPAETRKLSALEISQLKELTNKNTDCSSFPSEIPYT